MPKAATKAALKRRLSPAARAAMSTAGLRSLPMLQEARRTSVAVKTTSKEYEASLLAMFTDPTPIQRGQVLAATATYTALQLTLNKLRTANRYKTIAELIIQLNPLVASLQRSLRVLGVQSPDDVGIDASPRGGLQEYLASKAKASEVADDGTS